MKNSIKLKNALHISLIANVFLLLLSGCHSDDKHQSDISRSIQEHKLGVREEMRAIEAMKSGHYIPAENQVQIINDQLQQDNEIKTDRKKTEEETSDVEKRIESLGDKLSEIENKKGE